MLILEETAEPGHADPFAALLAPPTAATEVNLTAGRPAELRFAYRIQDRTGPAGKLLWLPLGTEPAAVADDTLIAAAAQQAARADVALVVVGTSPAVESEGYDRGSLALPGRLAAWSAPWPRPTRVLSCWSTREPRCCCPGATRSRPCSSAISAGVWAWRRAGVSVR